MLHEKTNTRHYVKSVCVCSSCNKLLTPVFFLVPCIGNSGKAQLGLLHLGAESDAHSVVLMWLTAGWELRWGPGWELLRRLPSTASSGTSDFMAASSPRAPHCRATWDPASWWGGTASTTVGLYEPAQTHGRAQIHLLMGPVS